MDQNFERNLQQMQDSMRASYKGRRKLLQIMLPDPAEERAKHDGRKPEAALCPCRVCYWARGR